MKKNVLIGIIVIVLIVAGVGAWYLLKSKNNTVVVPNQKSSESVTPNLKDSSGANISFADAYKKLTQAEKNCFIQALGQTKLDGFIKNDLAVMQTITGDEYEKVLACQK
jgi:hypothetical protein